MKKKCFVREDFKGWSESAVGACDNYAAVNSNYAFLCNKLYRSMGLMIFLPENLL